MNLPETITGQEKRGANKWVPEPIQLADLHFDARNPRLAEAASAANEAGILQVLWREFAVDEVAISIAHNGYWPHEPLIATREGKKLVVIEGNRRLAAVKLLRDANLRERVKATDLPRISESDRKKLAELPVVICEREEVWQYLGFRHLNGPQNWRSFAKAQYVAEVHREFGIPLGDIANKIGDQHSTVERLYFGYLVLTQAESAAGFDRNDCYKEHFSFSHLYTGLDYPGIKAFLGLPDDRVLKDSPVPRSKLKNLGDLMLWLYGSESEEVEPIVKSQNPHLRQLDETLLNIDGVTALRRGAPLKVSLEASRGDSRLFREAMQQAKESLQDARGKSLEGYEGEDDLLKTAESIVQLAESLLAEMKATRRSKGSSAKRRSTDK
jgi:hypothetical protein